MPSEAKVRRHNLETEPEYRDPGPEADEYDGIWVRKAIATYSHLVTADPP